MKQELKEERTTQRSHSRGEQQNQGKKKKKRRENGNFRSLNTSIKRGSAMQEEAISNTQRKKVLSLKDIDS